MDELTFSTNCENDQNSKTKNKKDNNDDDVPDISFFCDGQEDSDDEVHTTDTERNWKYSNNTLICRRNATSNKIINARTDSEKSLLFEEPDKANKKVEY